MLKPKLVSSYTIPVNKTIHLISFNPNTLPIGSFSYKILYPGDIDIREDITECCTKNEVSHKIAEKIQNIVRNVSNQSGFYFAEFKAGLDERYPLDRDKYVVRWSENDVLNGFKILPGGKILSLVNAIEQPSIVKLDIWAPVKGRYVEASNFMIIYLQDSNGKLTPLNGPQPDYVDSIKNDIMKYFTSSNLNAFKATKRMMLLANLFKDQNMLSKILPLINSGAGILYQVLSDMDTLSEMINRIKGPLPYNYFWNEIDSFKGRLSYINEFKFDEEQTDRILNQIIDGQLSGQMLIDTLDILQDRLLSKLNEYVLNYDMKNGIYPPPPLYKPDKMSQDIITKSLNVPN